MRIMRIVHIISTWPTDRPTKATAHILPNIFVIVCRNKDISALTIELRYSDRFIWHKNLYVSERHKQ